MRKADIIIAVFLILTAIAVWVSSASFKPGVQQFQTISPAFYPRLLAVAIAVIALLMLLFDYCYRMPSSGEAVKWGMWYKVLVGLTIMFFQAFALERIGFFLSTLICLTALMVMLSVRLWKSLLVSGIFLVFVYLFFIRGIGLRLPMVLLPRLFGGAY